MKRAGLMSILVSAAVCLGLSASPAAAQIFSESFPCGMALNSTTGWHGKGGSFAPYSGVVVPDPDPNAPLGNCALSFFMVTIGGDTFTDPIPVRQGRTYTLEFDYLGGFPPASGAIGISVDFPGGHRWLAGTTTLGGIEQAILQDGTGWNHYIVPFDPFTPGGSGYSGNVTAIRLMLEDFNTSVVGITPAHPNDVFFDNIELRAAFTVTIDIKPGSDPNSINLGSAGFVPVAILSTSDFDAPGEVDWASLSLAGAAVNYIGKGKKEHCGAEDVNGDELDDLVCHFETTTLSALEAGQGTLTLTGQTNIGEDISGSDAVNIVP